MQGGRNWSRASGEAKSRCLLGDLILWARTRELLITGWEAHATTDPATIPTLLEKLRKLAPLLAIPILAAALWLLYRELKHYNFHDVLGALKQITPLRLAVALGLVAVNYTVLIAYDWLASGISNSASRCVAWLWRRWWRT